MENRLSTRTFEEMKPVLMDATLEGPAIFYYMLRGGANMGNITVLESGISGGEYIKTFGHYHAWDFSETYHFLEGAGIALFQQRKTTPDGTPIEDSIESFTVTRVNAGDSLEIPLHAGHVLCNIGSTFLVTSDNSPSDAATTATRPHADYQPMHRMRGLAYYLVEYNGAPALRKNPLYKDYGALDASGIPVIQ